MDENSAKQFIMACHQAKKITENLPALPKGATPLCIRVIEKIHELNAASGAVRVSDIGQAMDLPLSNVTRTVKTLVRLGAVSRSPGQNDRREVHLRLTETGEAWYQKYVAKFYEHFCEAFSDISSETAQQTATVIAEIAGRFEKLSESEG
ncbi:MAG: MarR family winged helix-turn-helix transcriptional regulator [Pseudoramibacter sp.]